MARMGRPPENDYRKLVIMAEISIENTWMTLTAIARVVYEQSPDEHSEEGAIKRLTRKFKIHGAEIMQGLRAKEDKPERTYYRVPSSRLWTSRLGIDLSTLGIARSTDALGLAGIARSKRGLVADIAMRESSSIIASVSQMEKASQSIKDSFRHLNVPRPENFGASAAIMQASRRLTEQQKSMAEALSAVQPKGIQSLIRMDALTKETDVMRGIRASLRGISANVPNIGDIYP